MTTLTQTKIKTKIKKQSLVKLIKSTEKMTRAIARMKK